jgi:hypothetical protein
MSGFFSCASSSRSTSSFKYSSARSWNSVVEMSVGTVGFSVSSDCLGGGFSLSGIMPRTLLLLWKARTEALLALTAVARAMMPLAGVEALKGAATVLRSAREPILVTDFIVGVTGFGVMRE